MTLAAGSGSGQPRECHYRTVDALYILKIREQRGVNRLTARHLSNCSACRELFERMQESLPVTALERVAMRMREKTFVAPMERVKVLLWLMVVTPMVGI